MGEPISYRGDIGNIWHGITHRKETYMLDKLSKIIFDESLDMYEDGEYICDEKAREDYSHALEICLKFYIQGKCKIQADNPMKPYQYHKIDIVWDFKNDNVIELDAKDVIKSLKGMDLIIQDDNTWQIGKQIYLPK